MTRKNLILSLAMAGTALLAACAAILRIKRVLAGFPVMRTVTSEAIEPAMYATRIGTSRVMPRSSLSVTVVSPGATPAMATVRVA